MLENMYSFMVLQINFCLFSIDATMDKLKYTHNNIIHIRKKKDLKSIFILVKVYITEFSIFKLNLNDIFKDNEFIIMTLRSSNITRKK